MSVQGVSGKAAPQQVKQAPQQEKPRQAPPQNNSDQAVKVSLGASGRGGDSAPSEEVESKSDGGSIE